MTDCRIGVVGAAGRMGRVLLRLAATTPGYSLAAGSERPDTPDLGRDLGQLAGLGSLGLQLSDDARAVFAAAEEQRRAGGRVDLVAVVHLDDLDVPGGIEGAGNLGHQLGQPRARSGQLESI